MLSQNDLHSSRDKEEALPRFSLLRQAWGMNPDRPSLLPPEGNFVQALLRLPRNRIAPPSLPPSADRRDGQQHRPYEICLGEVVVVEKAK